VPKNLLYNHLKLHLIVFIYGFTAILGKLISLSAIHLVWYRMLIAALVLFFLLKINKTNALLPRRELSKIFGVGLIVGAHWITFFGAVKLSNVSVTLVCLSSATLFTSLLEALFHTKRIKITEVVIGLVIIAGIYLIFQFETRYWQGIVVATISAFLAAVFTVINSRLVKVHRARIISFYEMLAGFAGISLYLLFTNGLSILKILPPFADIVYLLILGIVCTAFAFVVQVDVMKKLSAYIVALTINLEPVYGILLAFFIFGTSEYMSAGFYIGTFFIMLSVFGYPIWVHYNEKKQNNNSALTISKNEC
jgi:drug/metabolite transporter (DMT)-like permease